MQEAGLPKVSDSKLFRTSLASRLPHKCVAKWRPIQETVPPEEVSLSHRLALCAPRSSQRLDLINDGINLVQLRGNLASVFTKHAEESYGCQGRLGFRVDTEYGVSVLMCSCSVCGGEYVAL